jgi:hypothetical protein
MGYMLHTRDFMYGLHAAYTGFMCGRHAACTGLMYGLHATYTGFMYGIHDTFTGLMYGIHAAYTGFFELEWVVQIQYQSMPKNGLLGYVSHCSVNR